MTTPSTDSVLSIKEAFTAIRSATYYLSDSDSTKVGEVDDKQVGILVRAIGTKAKTRWEVGPDRLFETLSANIEIDPDAAGSVIRIAFKDSPPLVEMTTSHDAAAMMALLVDSLQWQLKKDRVAKRRLEAFAREREKRADAARSAYHRAAMERINQDVDDLRRALTSALPLFNTGLGVLGRLERVKPHAEKLRDVQDALSDRGDRGGKLNRLINLIEYEYGIYRAKEVPRLLSKIGMLIDANFCLRFLEARDACDRHFGIANETLHGYGYISGWHRPHTELLKDMPHYFFDGPGYLAPVEDLLDWCAIEFYAAGKQTVADDATVGWLLSEIAKGADQDLGLLNSLAAESKYWNEARLRDCEAAWEAIKIKR